MHAVILAGGAGTRLRPLTYARRKELIPILNRPLLEYRLLNLKQHGVLDVAIACSQGAGEIEQHFGDGSELGVRITYAYEDRPLGSGRAVKEAARAAGAMGTLVVCNGDILTNVDLSSMLRRHRETGATLSMSLAPVDDPWAYGVVEVTDDLRILSFVEKPPQGEEPSNLINAGTWLWEPPMLERIADDESAVRDGFSERVLFPGIIADGLRVQGFVEDLWVDCGSPERVLRATRLLLERRARDEGAGPWIGAGADVHASGQVGERVLIGAGAVVEAGAVLGGDTVIGERTRVGEGAAIDDSVVWEDGDIGNGVAARGSIIADGVVVGDGASMVDAVIASRARVAAGAQLPDGARVEPDGSV